MNVSEGEADVSAIIEEAKSALDVAKGDIDGAAEMLSLYDKLMENVIPWKEFNETLVVLDQFRKEFSIESAALLVEIKVHMMNGINEYFAASQTIYEWASVTASQLKLYIKLFGSDGARRPMAQKQILMKMLEDGISKMTTAQEELGKSSSSFNTVSGELFLLRSRFGHEFDEKSEYFQAKKRKIRIGSYVGGAVFGIPGVIVSTKLVNRFIIRKMKKKMRKIQAFYDNLDEKVAQASINIDDTKKVLKAVSAL